ncbi:MAG: T9SS C-terminal target domain-containing protein, partial [Chitinophagia bacterium]|nr:T9SS C-terminal target domain-containing protein [Chitinophagia bacterium]
DANHHLFDGMLLSFNNDAHATNDRNLDARKPMGPDFNLFSITNDSSYLALDARPFDTASVIPLGIRSNYKQDYIISTESIHIPEGGSLFLHDKWLEKYVAMEAGSEYKFSVTKDAKSQGNGRFEICMKPANTTIADVTALQVVMLPNPATDEVNVTYKAPAAEEVNIRIMDITGKDVFTRNVGVSQNGTVKLPVNQLAAGIYMVEFTSGNNKVIQRLIKE